VNVPYAPHDENNHAPNENIKVEGFLCGVKATAAFLYEAAKL
jgi:acetylornithine deacetylase/succinyl-diaminopimelate desuccinylase-like protein